jgi:hypothetical protein
VVSCLISTQPVYTASSDVEGIDIGQLFQPKASEIIRDYERTASREVMTIDFCL